MTQGKFQRKEKKFHPPSHISKRPFLEIDQKDFQFKTSNQFHKILVRQTTSFFSLNNHASDKKLLLQLLFYFSQRES